MCLKDEVTSPSSSPGLDSSDEPSTPASKRPTRQASASQMRSTSSMGPERDPSPGLVLLTQKWSCPTPKMADKLVESVTLDLQGMSKVTSGMMPGWVVHWSVYCLTTTVRVVWWVEPDGCPF